jgi:hypothetical protein
MPDDQLNPFNLPISGIPEMLPPGSPVQAQPLPDDAPFYDPPPEERLVNPTRWALAGIAGDLSQFFLSGARAPLQGLGMQMYRQAMEHNDKARKALRPQLMNLGGRLVKVDPRTGKTEVVRDFSPARYVTGPDGGIYQDREGQLEPVIAGRPAQPFGSSTTGYFTMGEDGTAKEVVPGMLQPDKPQIFGGAESGYHAYQDGQVQQLVPGTGGAPAAGWGPLDLKSAQAEYLRNPAVETYQVRKSALTDLESLLAKENSTSDAAAVRLYAKAVNGGGVLSDADVAGLANTSGGIWAQVGSMLEKAKSGELTHSEREQMKQAATELYRGAHAELSEYQQRVLPLLGNHDPSAVFSATGLLGPLETGPQTTAGGFGNGSPLQFAPGVTPDTVIEIPGFE